MKLRHSNILKVFAILLFSFELFAPVIVPVTSVYQNNFSETTIQPATQTQPFDLLSHLLFEEVSSEEREGKGDFPTTLCYIELFNALQKFKPVQITQPFSKEHYDTHPPLFTLHRVLVI
jgi:hypothetical protein